MPAPEINVQYVADLARLKLSSDEVARFQKQLGDIIGYVAKLQEINVDHVVPRGSESHAENNLRSDDITPSFPLDIALSNAPAKAQDLITVPKILE